MKNNYELKTCPICGSGKSEESNPDVVCATVTKTLVEGYTNMKVKHLKTILASIEDDEMDVIIPVLDSDDPKFIHGFRHVRTAGILSNEYEPNLALCLSAPDDGLDMESQIHHNGFETQCEKVLF